MFRVSSEMRRICKDRIDRAMTDDIERKRKEDKKARLERDYAEMRKIVKFFYDNCPVEIEESEKKNIEKTLFNGKGSKNKYGTVMFLKGIIGFRWPEWEEIAKKEFNIDF